MAQLSVFDDMLKRASSRLEVFFRESQGKNAAAFVDPGFEVVINRIVHPDAIRECFQHIYNYNTNKSMFDFDELVIFTAGTVNHLTQYVNAISAAKVKPRAIKMAFVNRFTFIARQYLESVGWLDTTTVFELRLPAWIIDSDVATLELPFSYTDVLIDGGDVAVERVADVLNSFRPYTYFSNMFFIGDAAVKVAKKIPPYFKSPWTHIIVFDRRCDLVTPFMTPFTYEALVADSLGIRYGIAENSQGYPVLFSQADAVSAQARGLMITEAPDFLKELSSQVREESEKARRGRDLREGTELLKSYARTTVHNLSLGDHLTLLQDTVAQVTAHPLFSFNLQNELNCVKGTIPNRNFVRDTIALSTDWRVPVRLLALYHQTSTKEAKDLDEIRQTIIDRFGMEALAALWTLEDAGIVKERSPPSHWQAMSSRFGLVQDEARCRAEKPYNGFSPLILKLFQRLAKQPPEWNDCQVAFDALKINCEVRGNRCSKTARVLVVFVGGSTYGEVAALRAQKLDSRVDVDVLTTSMLSQRSLFDQLAGIPSK